MKLARSFNAARTYFCLIVAFIFFAISVQSVWAQDTDVEKALLEFHNTFLPGVNSYQTKIEYPKSEDYYFAWASLVIAVGEDTAIILTAGHSETVVKVVEKGLTAVDVGTGVAKTVDGKPAEAAVEYAVGEAVNHGLKKFVGTSIPGFRSGVAVYGVVSAGEEEQERIFQSIAEQKEIQQFITEIAPSIVSIQKQIDAIESPDKRTQYQQMLSAMLQKKAELTVYRQMQEDNNRGSIGGLEYEILQQINPAMSNQLADGELTPNRQLSNAASEYAAGRINKDQLVSQIKDYIRDNSNEPSSYTEAMLDKRLEAVQWKFDELDRAKSEINRYGGSIIQENHELSSYGALNKIVPQDYRMIANLDIDELAKEIPTNFKSAEPDQGTVVPDTAKDSIPKYLRKDSATQTIMTSNYQSITKKGASTILKEYKSIPGGVTLEGAGQGLEGITKVSFRKSDGYMVLNDSLTYEIPVTLQEMKEILLAISENDKMGVSLAGEYIVYGALPRENDIALNIRLVDKLLGHIAFGGHHDEEFGDYKLANGYQPKKNNRPRLSGMCVYFRFGDYRFKKNSARYELESSHLAIALVPTKKDERAKDGGALPDLNAIEKGYLPDAWKKNCEHISANIDYYMKERMMRIVNCYGEAAAFARALKRNGIDLKKLAASM